MVKLCHEKMLILRCILPKKLNHLQNKLTPPPEKSQHPVKNLKSLGKLSACSRYKGQLTWMAEPISLPVNLPRTQSRLYHHPVWITVIVSTLDFH